MKNIKLTPIEIAYKLAKHDAVNQIKKEFVQ